MKVLEAIFEVLKTFFLESIKFIISTFEIPVVKATTIAIGIIIIITIIISILYNKIRNKIFR